MGNVCNVGLLAAAAGTTEEVTFGVDGLWSYELFGQTLWITTSHVSLVIVMLVIIAFAVIANRVIKKADPNEVPGTFLNIIEMAVEAVDSLTKSNMGEKGYKFSNYIGTLFLFLITANLSGLFGLRPPTADYGTTLGLALITFILIHYNGFKYEKFGHITKLFQPVLLTPINIIGELATPMSMSLRLFGNILSGTVMMGLIYGLLPMLLQVFIWPLFGVLHGYFDVFSGLIQSYVFCMLTMVFIAQTFGDEEG
ncbi:MAG: F0F1 ATP synthase subunit A [Lachnospiraceae bacterium]|nr:F0F1 ATP synthase subunit A [Lachnospiraceae bacterium]